MFSIFLAEETYVHGKAYKTIATYKCALCLPLKVCCDLDLDSFGTKIFMMGV